MNITTSTSEDLTDADRPDLTELQSSDELCEFYRGRIREFEKEREVTLNRLNACTVQREELHRTEWELRKRVEEVKELQKALSDAHTYLFDERQRLLEMRAENDELKLQELEDRKRIQHLLALTEPIEQEVTYYRNKGAEKLHLYPPGVKKANLREDSEYMGKDVIKVTGVPRPLPPHLQQPVQPSERIMRTVYLPTSNVESLLLKCESLQAQLNEQKRHSNDRVAALLEDRRIREADEEAYRKTMERRVEELTGKINRAEDLVSQTTRDYIVQRREAQENERVKMEKIEEVKRERERLIQERIIMQQKHEENMKELRETLEREHEAYLQQFRAQIKKREEELVGLESVHSAVMTQYTTRIAELEVSLDNMRDKYKQLEQRRAMDLEGFTNDVTTLRKQILALNRKLHQMRLAGQLQEAEQLDRLVEAIDERTKMLEYSPAARHPTHDMDPPLPLSPGSPAPVPPPAGSRMAAARQVRGAGNGGTANQPPRGRATARRPRGGRSNRNDRLMYRPSEEEPADLTSGLDDIQDAVTALASRIGAQTDLEASV